MNRFPVVSFNSGEISPLVDARSDVEKYRSGCRILENMIPRIYGPAERRPGTKYIETVNGAGRVIPFIYSNTIAYIVLLEDRKMYFYYNGGQVLDSWGRRLKIDTPYLEADLFELQYKQSNDVMWITHSSYAPRKLSRTSANAFSLDEITFDNGPFLERNDLANGDEVMLKPSVTTGSGTLRAFATLFTEDAATDITSEAGCVYAASSVSGAYTADKAFDNIITTLDGWLAATLTNAWISCQWTTAKIITKVKVLNSLKEGLAKTGTRHCKIEASNDAITWTKVPAIAWSGFCQEYNNDEIELLQAANLTSWATIILDNSTSYTYYRLFAYDCWLNPIYVPLLPGSFEARYPSINEIEMMEESVTAGIAAEVFYPGHVGALFSLFHPRAMPSLNDSMTAPNTGIMSMGGETNILVEGAFTFTTHGTWSGTIQLERSINEGVTWEVYKTWVSDADRNVQYAGIEEEANILYRIHVVSLVANTAPYTGHLQSKVHAELNVDSSLQEGICRITGYTSATEVSMTVVKDFASTDADLRWSEGSWSGYRGYPKCVTFFENRCIYAGTAHQPQTVWFSASDEFEDFSECTKDDAAFSLTMSSDTRNAIQWISGVESILAGTTGNEWRIWADGESLTPNNFQFKPQTERGSKDMQALPCGDVVLFVDFVGRKVRELTFDGSDKYKYVSPDLTALAEHITEGGITSMAFQRNPDPILWCTRDDGTLISMTYEREQNVIAWSRHPFNRGGEVESNGYAVVPSYPVLQIADSTFEVRHDDLDLPQTTAVSTLLDLQHMADNLEGNYYLTNDIDASETVNWNGGAGFIPIGEHSSFGGFSGTFDGCGYTISGLTINRPTTWYVGLFGVVAGGQIANVTLSNVNICGRDYTGALVGDLYSAKDPENIDTFIQQAKIHNCHSSGIVKLGGLHATYDDPHYIGGLVGAIYGGKTTESAPQIDDSTSSCTIDPVNYNGVNHTGVATGSFIGGFIGGITYRYANIYNCRASGQILADSTGTVKTYSVGGFIGTMGNYQYTHTIEDCAATGAVNGTSQVGGFIGYLLWTSHITRCSARGNVLAYNTDAAGFVPESFGDSDGRPVITDCYAWGSVETQGTTVMDGAVRHLQTAGFGGIWELTDATNVYSIGVLTSVGGTEGGLISTDTDDCTMIAGFWDTEASGESTSALGIGHDTNWMMTKYNYELANWDFSTVWDMPDPVLWTEYGPGANSVAVIPGSAEDEVWLIVSRVIGGQLVRYLEQMQPRNWGDNQEDCWFVDSGLDYDGELTTTLSGLDHLEGEEVCIFGDGAVYRRQTVTNAQVTLTNAVSRAIVGLPFRYKLKPMRFDISTGASTTQTAIKRIPEVIVSFYKSGNVEYGIDTDHLFKIDWRTTEAYGSPPALHTGDKPLNPEGGFDPEDSLILTGDSPLPCTIRAIVPRIIVTGR